MYTHTRVYNVFWYRVPLIEQLRYNTGASTSPTYTAGHDLYPAMKALFLKFEHGD